MAGTKGVVRRGGSSGGFLTRRGGSSRGRGRSTGGGGGGRSTAGGAGGGRSTAGGGSAAGGGGKAIGGGGSAAGGGKGKGIRISDGPLTITHPLRQRVPQHADIGEPSGGGGSPPILGGGTPPTNPKSNRRASSSHDSNPVDQLSPPSQGTHHSNVSRTSIVPLQYPASSNPIVGRQQSHSKGQPRSSLNLNIQPQHRLVEDEADEDDDDYDDDDDGEDE